MGRDLYSLQNDRTALQNQIRATLLQGLGGVVLAIGAYATWRQVRTSREVHSTDRFIRAIEQLGDRENAPEVVLGGLYGLERVARDSPQDRRTIAEILTAFVRARRDDFVSESDLVVSVLMDRAPHVQAAISVLGRGHFSDIRLFHEEDIRTIDLSSADLRHADLRNGDYRGAWMTSARLYRAFAVSADFSWTDFSSSSMQSFIGNGSKFAGASLHFCACTDAHFDHADFRESICQATDFQGSHLVGSDFRNAFLGEANFFGANLQGVRFRGAIADEGTIWPDLFDPKSEGIRIIPRDPHKLTWTPTTTTVEERNRGKSEG